MVGTFTYFERVFPCVADVLFVVAPITVDVLAGSKAKSEGGGALSVLVVTRVYVRKGLFMLDMRGAQPE
jgi:hypothetical protein